MAYGLLASKPLTQNLTEFEIYQAPSNKRAVGTIVVCNSDELFSRRITLFITSATGSVSGMFTAGLIDTTSKYGFLIIGGLCKVYNSDDGVPLTVSGVVIGPNQRLIAFDNTFETVALGESLVVSFNGVEEDV